VPEKLTDLILVRQSGAARAMQRIAPYYISKDNELSHMLNVADLDWMNC